MFITQYSAEYGLIMAASVVALIPVFTKVKMVRVDRAGRLRGSMMCHQMPY